MLLLGYGRPFPDPRGKGFSVCFRVRSFNSSADSKSDIFLFNNKYLIIKML